MGGEHVPHVVCIIKLSLWAISNILYSTDIQDRDKCYMLCNGHQLVMLWSKKVMSSLHCTSIDLVQVITVKPSN